MDEKLKTEMMLIFNQGFEELVMPAIREMKQDLRKEMKDGFKQVSVEFDKVNEHLDSMDEKLERLDRSHDRIADEQVDFRARLRRVENAVFKKVD